MKKHYLLLYTILYLGISALKGQYSVLHYFNDTLGSMPYVTSLEFSNGKLYGQAEGGGINNYGVIFTLDTNGNNYKIIHYFNDTMGLQPSNPPTIFGRKLFGMTNGGGSKTYGVIFSIDTDGSNYKVLLNFNDSNGKQSSGNVLTIGAGGSKLFGEATYGGMYGYGNVFSMDTSGMNFKVLYNFNDTDGAYPVSSLTYTGGIIYGETYDGGTNGSGIIFSMDTDGSNFRHLYDFANSGGSNPIGGLQELRNKFYGMTSLGGNYGCGTVYSIDFNGSNYLDLFDLASPTGCQSSGSLTYNNFRHKAEYYGTTQGGGSNSYGVLFSIDTNGSNYSVLYNFNQAMGTEPSGWLTVMGNTVFGTAQYGGINNYGVVYKFNGIATGITPVSRGFPQVYPNPSFGVFNFQISNNEQGISNIEVYDVLGEKVETECIPSLQTSSFTIDLRSQPNGIYFYRVLGENGTMVGNGKLIIDR